MRTSVSVNSPKLKINKRGMSLLVVLMVTGVVGISSLMVLNMGTQKRIVAQQMNMVVSADLIKQKLIGAVISPRSWQLTQANNNAAFAGFNPAAPPLLNLYKEDSGAVFYQAANAAAGFDFKGNQCTTFTNGGNDSCPFHYDISLKNRVLQNGSWIDTLHFALRFKPASTTFVLNAGSPQFTFDIVRNLDDRSVESSCLSVNGIYDAATNLCSVKVTKPVAACAGPQTYRGPASNVALTNCDNKIIAVTTCLGAQVVKGFALDGSPTCGAP